MNAKVKPIPDGFHSVTPYLTINGAAKAIEFYKRAFGATERFRLPGPREGSVGHAELLIGNSIIMLADEFPECGNQSPPALKGTPVSLLFYVEDVDAAFQRAVDAGAIVKEAVENKFYGERAGSVIDPFGHQWTLMTHIEDVTAEEVRKRMEAMLSATPGDNKGA